MIRTERLLLRRFRQSDYHSAIWVPVDMFFCTGEDMDSFFLGQNKKMNVRIRALSYTAEILVYKLQNWCKIDTKKSTRNGGNYHGYELCLLCKGRTGRKVWI